MINCVTDEATVHLLDTTDILVHFHISKKEDPYVITNRTERDDGTDGIYLYKEMLDEGAVRTFTEKVLRIQADTGGSPGKPPVYSTELPLVITEGVRILGNTEIRTVFNLHFGVSADMGEGLCSQEETEALAMELKDSINSLLSEGKDTEDSGYKITMRLKHMVADREWRVRTYACSYEEATCYLAETFNEATQGIFMVRGDEMRQMYDDACRLREWTGYDVISPGIFIFPGYCGEEDPVTTMEEALKYMKEPYVWYMFCKGFKYLSNCLALAVFKPDHGLKMAAFSKRQLRYIGAARTDNQDTRAMVRDILPCFIRHMMKEGWAEVGGKAEKDFSKSVLLHDTEHTRP